MGKTFDQSLIDTARISMSMLDVDDISNTTSEEFLELRREQQGCHNELTHREDFPFGKFNKVINIQEGVTTYSLPIGQVQNLYIKNKKLQFLDDYLTFDEQIGTPEFYSVRNNPSKLVIYPTPQMDYTAILEYYDDRYVLDTDGNPQWEISIGSTLRMPERVQHLYFDALEYFLLADHIKKQTNARWQPTMQIAEARWQTFLRGARRADTDTYIII